MDGRWNATSTATQWALIFCLFQHSSPIVRSPQHHLTGHHLQCQWVFNTSLLVAATAAIRDYRWQCEGRRTLHHKIWMRCVSFPVALDHRMVHWIWPSSIRLDYFLRKHFYGSSPTTSSITSSIRPPFIKIFINIQLDHRAWGTPPEASIVNGQERGGLLTLLPRSVVVC